MSNLLNNNNYYNLSAYSLKLNGLDVQTEIDNLTNANTWTNTDGGSVEPSTGLVLTTNGIGDNAVANANLSTTYDDINEISYFHLNNNEKSLDLSAGTASSSGIVINKSYLLVSSLKINLTQSNIDEYLLNSEDSKLNPSSEKDILDFSASLFLPALSASFIVITSLSVFSGVSK